MTIDWDSYEPHDFYDDMMCGPGRPRDEARAVAAYLASLSTDEIRSRQLAAEAAIDEMGITFTVYSEGSNIDRAWPFDIIPRIISATEWRRIERGPVAAPARAQPVHRRPLRRAAHRQGRRRSRRSCCAGSSNFRPQCVGAARRTACGRTSAAPISSATADGKIYVLEDNLRVPSGVSYMLENRQLMKRMFARAVRRPEHPAGRRLPEPLLRHAAARSRRGRGDTPVVVVLTPGIYNSAYFEHCFLAQQMGVELVEGADLVVGRRLRVHAHDRRACSAST